MIDKEDKDDDYHSMPAESTADLREGSAGGNANGAPTSISVPTAPTIEGLTKLFQKDKCELDSSAAGGRRRRQQTNPAEVQIRVAGNDEVTYYRVSDESQNYFRVNEPIYKYVVAVAGRSRIGKSCFLKHLFQIDKSIMQVGAGDRPVTQGMDLINKPYVFQPQDDSSKPAMDFTILDCQGLNNQFDLEVDNDIIDAGLLNRALEQQDVLLFASTALFAGVILYYYDTNLSAAELSTIVEASKILRIWRESGSSQNVLTNALSSGYKPKIIFLRRNTSDTDKALYQPIPDKEENNPIREAFDIFNDTTKITLPAPVEADDLHRVEDLGLEELTPGYKRRLEEVKGHIYDICTANSEIVPGNLTNFLTIGSELEFLFRNAQKENIQKLLEEEQLRMQRLRQKERMFMICRRLIGTFCGLILLVLLLAIINVCILYTSLLNGENCRTLQVQNDISLLRANLLTRRPLCYQCLTDEMYLEQKQVKCLHECPLEQGPAKLNESRTAPKQKTCGLCSEHAINHCLRCKDMECLEAKKGYFIKAETRGNFTFKVARKCERANVGCSDCTQDGKYCKACQPNHKFNNGKCQLQCEYPKYYDSVSDKCDNCPIYWHRDPDDQTMCLPGKITKDRSYIDKEGQEQDCLPYMIPREPVDIQTSKVPTGCMLKSCPENQKITPDGICEDCPKYQLADPNNAAKSCKLKYCSPTKFITRDGKCLDCPSDQLQDQNDPGVCKAQKCKPNEKKVYKQLSGNEETIVCQKCPDYFIGDARGAYKNCTRMKCENKHQRATMFGECKDCPPFMVYMEDNPARCMYPQCPSDRYHLSREGQCQLCPDYQRARENRQSCYQPSCQGEREIINQQAKCEQCPEGYKGDPSKTHCVKIQCQAPMVLQGNLCDTCPPWQGFDTITKRCKSCLKGCKYCTADRTSCEESGKVQRIVQNAKGNMGKVTFTLEWHDHVDLDLWLMCGTEKVYYGHTLSTTCDARLDVDMVNGDTYYNYKRDPVHHPEDVGQLENLYINNLYDGNYQSYVNWFSGTVSSTSYTLYVTRLFCGGYITPQLYGQNDKCLREIVYLKYANIQSGNTPGYSYYYDPNLRYDQI